MTNLSKQKREVLEGKIELLRGKLDATDVEAQNALFALEAELKHKKYGLVWEEHEEEVDHTLSENLPVLTEQTELAVSEGGLTHFLLEGDNLAALQILKRTHKGKIDVIYIDPPYNTGNSFMYNDTIIGDDDAFKHSKWLSFMKPRLQMAYELLEASGCIFISINDYEGAPVKLLLDEVFGERNFLGQLTWESTTQPTNAGSARFSLQKKVESIYLYSKNRAQLKDFILREEESNFNYPHQGKFGKCRFQIIEKSDAGGYNRESMKFKILGQYPREGKRWQIGEAKARELEEQGKVEIVDGIVKIAIYPEDEKDRVKYKPFWSHLDAQNFGTAQNGKDELNKIIGNAVGFDTVKPVNLIKEFLCHFHKNATVLDFFAGSGTTGQAVLELNEEDGGNRKFILCTNNENDICRNITYERMKTVVTGKRQDGSAYSDGIAATLKYDKIDYVAVKEDGDILLYDDYADELLAHVREMVELENGISFESDSTIKICLYEDELDEFVDALDEKSEVRAVYVGHDLLMTAQQKAKLAALNVAVNIIPQYYYEDEV